jgi:hypothetical protein
MQRSNLTETRFLRGSCWMSVQGRVGEAQEDT